MHPLVTRIFCALLIGLSCATQLFADQAPVPTGTVRAAFWNIRWFPGGRPNAYRGEQIKQTNAVHSDIVKLNADVIGFEEVRDWDNAALAVKPLPGFKVDVCSNFP